MAERIRHLRLTLGFSGVVLVLATVVGFAVRGGVGALGVAAGVVLVAASYTASTLAIAWADTVNPRMVLPVGMGMYITKFSLLGLLLVAVEQRRMGRPDPDGDGHRRRHRGMDGEPDLVDGAPLTPVRPRTLIAVAADVTDDAARVLRGAEQSKAR